VRPVARAVLSAALTLGVVPSPVATQIPIVDGQRIDLGLSGYVRVLTGVHDRGFDLPESLAGDRSRTAGFHGEVVRLKWQLEAPSWRLDLHQRLQVRIPAGEAFGAAAGFGVSARPERLVRLDTELLDEPSVRALHDLDRLSVTVYSVADITIGRQPITWGVSTLFPVADLWAQFSPFELDTEEKPGVDAVRALFYPADGLELDAVVADRGTLEDLSAGVRATLGLASTDVWAGAGKFWRELMVMGGATVLLDESRLRAEAVLPWDMDDDAFDRPRATFGLDWIRGTLVLGAEYHYNGIGAAGADGYLAVAADPRLGRGESYYLGRHYLGGLLAWSPDSGNRVNLGLSALVNAVDGSAALTPTFGYDLGQTTTLSVGGLLSVGRAPVVTTSPPAIDLDSEFGAYGDLLFTRLSVYF
jgi:hypothetical protein